MNWFLFPQKNTAAFLGLFQRKPYINARMPANLTKILAFIGSVSTWERERERERVIKFSASRMPLASIKPVRMADAPPRFLNGRCHKSDDTEGKCFGHFSLAWQSASSSCKFKCFLQKIQISPEKKRKWLFYRRRKMRNSPPFAEKKDCPEEIWRFENLKIASAFCRDAVHIVRTTSD